MDKKPGDKFKEEAQPFLEEIREAASQAYHKLLEISQEFGHKLQKTLDHVPGLGIGGTTHRPQNTPESNETDDNSSSNQG